MSINRFWGTSTTSARKCRGDHRRRSSAEDDLPSHRSIVQPLDVLAVRQSAVRPQLLPPIHDRRWINFAGNHDKRIRIHTASVEKSHVSPIVDARQSSVSVETSDCEGVVCQTTTSHAHECQVWALVDQFNHSHIKVCAANVKQDVIQIRSSKPG